MDTKEKQTKLSDILGNMEKDDLDNFESDYYSEDENTKELNKNGVEKHKNQIVHAATLNDGVIPFVNYSSSEEVI